MAFDYKKEYKEFYLPKDKPSIVTVPSMNYIAVRGKGDPNAEDGEYAKWASIFLWSFPLTQNPRPHLPESLFPTFSANR